MNKLYEWGRTYAFNDRRGSIIIHCHDNHTVTLEGEKCSITLVEGTVIKYRGIHISHLVMKVEPFGVVLVDSEYSFRSLWPWNVLLRKDGVLRDSLHHTGWVSIE